jgi:L-lactate permease
MRYLLYLFYLEILINLASISQGLFMPAAFVMQFSGEPVSTAGAEVARWYAVLILVISYLLWRALQVRGKTLKVVLEALLVGDFVQIGAAIVTANQLGEWPLVVTAALVISIVLAVARLLCLWQPQLAGIEHVGNTTTDSGSN